MTKMNIRKEYLENIREDLEDNYKGELVISSEGKEFSIIYNADDTVYIGIVDHRANNYKAYVTIKKYQLSKIDNINELNFLLSAIYDYGEYRLKNKALIQ